MSAMRKAVLGGAGLSAGSLAAYYWSISKTEVPDTRTVFVIDEMMPNGMRLSDYTGPGNGILKYMIERSHLPGDGSAPEGILLALTNGTDCSNGTIMSMGLSDEDVILNTYKMDGWLRGEMGRVVNSPHEGGVVIDKIVGSGGYAGMNYTHVCAGTFDLENPVRIVISSSLPAKNDLLNLSSNMRSNNFDVSTIDQFSKYLYEHDGRYGEFGYKYPAGAPRVEFPDVVIGADIVPDDYVRSGTGIQDVHSLGLDQVDLGQILMFNMEQTGPFLDEIVTYLPLSGLLYGTMYLGSKSDRVSPHMHKAMLKSYGVANKIHGAIEGGITRAYDKVASALGKARN